MTNRFKEDIDLPLAADVRWELIVEAMGRCDDDPYKAGQMIGISGRTLLREVAIRKLPWSPVRRSHANKRLSLPQVQKALQDAGGDASAAAIALGYRDGGQIIRRWVKEGKITG